ncbi:DEAD/DEAH box helicase [Devosia sp. Leaf64]|uniref:SNF2-related protein n=1 Tax=Devosia sp. Leaf64 TaxID=1736229 RepID=UPI00071509C0|nr:DEAD/DEAH box helicase [Devosia sp. Leaf64]KQN75092.1 hypothetical protein ASE94_01875 [Devosia sp. Leaf64]
MFHTTTELMTHQARAVAKLSPSRVAALFMDMGTGKSLTALRLAELKQANWNKLFWFCPCALRQTVLEQIIEHTDIPADMVTVWNQQGMRKRSRRDDALVHIIGIETMSSSTNAVLRYNQLLTEDGFVIVDESSYIKANRAKRTQRITAMSDRSRYRMIMTGTPLTDSIIDLFAQMTFLSPKILGHNSWYSFANAHIEYETKPSRFNKSMRIRTGRVLRTFDKDVLAAQIEPYVFQVRREECLDLPKQIYVDRTCELAEWQRELYEQAKLDALASRDWDAWNDTSILQLFTTLQKIVVGFAGQVVRADNPRIDLLLETIGEIADDEPLIIWTKYLEAADTICQILGRHYGSDQVWKFTGRVGETQRNHNLENWRRKGRFLIATQAIGGHGLTLNEAAYSLFYADSFKYAERIQAEGRNHRIGQERPVVYTTLRCEDTIDNRIEHKLQLTDSVVSDFRRMVDSLVRQGDQDAIKKAIASL